MIRKKQKKCDLQHCKNANAAVQGYVYLVLNNKCIDTLMDINSKSNDRIDEKHQMVQLLKLAKDSNNESKKLFVKAQRSISNHVCSENTSSQFNRLHKNDGKWRNIK